MEKRLTQMEKFAMIGRLSGGLAHELGSPLSVIGMRAEAIEQRAAQDPEIVEQARAISAEVLRMSSFLQGLLHLSGAQGVVFSRVDVRDVIRRVQSDVAPFAADAGVELDVSAPAEPVWVRGQEQLLCHALRNGVRNAIQVLRGRAGERRAAVRVIVTRAEVALIVEDTGPGIAAADLPHVFEPFHTTKPVGEGIGLGLAITHGIIEEHGGDATIENRAEGGVRLTLLLPRAPHVDSVKDPT